MALSRRRFLQIMATAGVAVPTSSWLWDRLEAYAKERLSFADVRGPGLETFSRTVCRDCANHCGLAFRRIDGIPVGLRGTRFHPASRGALCPAGQTLMQGLFDPDRLSSPILREDALGPGKTVDYASAISMLRDRLARLISSGHGDRIAVLDGRTGSLGANLIRSWTESIPGARHIPFRIESAFDRVVAGFFEGTRDGRLVFDLENAGVCVFVGAEVLEIDGSPVCQMRAHGQRRESRLRGGAPTVYIGPRQGPTGVKADLWIPCGPGQERRIVLALAEALSRTHPDRDRVMAEYARWVPEARDPLGFARTYSLEHVAPTLGTNREEIDGLLRAFADFGQGVSMFGPGILRRTNGSADAKAIMALNLWTNGFRSPGGFSWKRDPLWDISSWVGLAFADRETSAQLGGILDPLLEIKRSPIDALVCLGANLPHELPGRDQITRALSHIPFVASFATHEDEMSHVSHITIPVPMGAESWDIPAPAWGFPTAAIQVQRPALVPVLELQSAEDIVIQIASAGIAGPRFRPRGESMQQLVERAVESIVSGRRGMLVSSDEARSIAQGGAGPAGERLLSGEAIWIPDGGPPPTRTRARPIASVLTPLVEPAPGQIWLMAFDGPAIHGGRILNRPMMMELSGHWRGRAWESWVEINPVDARRLGIRNGDSVRIRGPRAEIVCPGVITAAVARGVAAAPVGFGQRAMGRVARGHGVNVLDLPNASFDAESDAPIWGPIPVFLSKA